MGQKRAGGQTPRGVASKNRVSIEIDRLHDRRVCPVAYAECVQNGAICLLRGHSRPEISQPFARGCFPGCVRVPCPRCLKPVQGPLRRRTPESAAQDLASMLATQPPIHFNVDAGIPVSEAQKRSQKIYRRLAKAIRSQAKVRQVPVKERASAGQAVPALQEGEFREHFCRS